MPYTWQFARRNLQLGVERLLSEEVQRAVGVDVRASTDGSQDTRIMYDFQQQKRLVDQRACCGDTPPRAPSPSLEVVPLPPSPPSQPATCAEADCKERRERWMMPKRIKDRCC